MTVNSSLVAFGQAEPPLEIEIVPDLFELSLSHEKAGQEADHQRGHMLANRIPIPLESVDRRPDRDRSRVSQEYLTHGSCLISTKRLIVSCMAGIASQSQRPENNFTEIVIRRQQPRQARKRLLA